MIDQDHLCIPLVICLPVSHLHWLLIHVSILYYVFLCIYKMLTALHWFFIFDMSSWSHYSGYNYSLSFLAWNDQFNHVPLKFFVQSMIFLSLHPKCQHMSHPCELDGALFLLMLPQNNLSIVGRAAGVRFLLLTNLLLARQWGWHVSFTHSKSILQKNEWILAGMAMDL